MGRGILRRCIWIPAWLSNRKIIFTAINIPLLIVAYFLSPLFPTLAKFDFYAFLLPVFFVILLTYFYLLSKIVASIIAKIIKKKK